MILIFFLYELWTTKSARMTLRQQKEEKGGTTRNKLDVPNQKDQILINYVYDPPCDQMGIKIVKIIYMPHRAQI